LLRGFIVLSAIRAPNAATESKVLSNFDFLRGSGSIAGAPINVQGMSMLFFCALEFIDKSAA